MAHASCVMRPAHGSCVLTHGSCVRRHASCVMRPASGVMRPTLQASCVRLMAHASGVRLMAHVSCVMRPTCPIQPPPVVGHDDNRNGGNFPMLSPSDLRPLSCTAWGNRVVLPPPYSPTGTNRNSGRRSKERRPLLLLIRKRPALRRPCS